MATRSPIIAVSGQLQELPATDVLRAAVLLANSTPTVATTLTAVSQAVFANTTGGAFTITLPTAVGNSGLLYYIKLIGSLALTIATTASQTIDGSASAVISVQYASLTLCSNGANWFIL